MNTAALPGNEYSRRLPHNVSRWCEERSPYRGPGGVSPGGQKSQWYLRLLLLYVLELTLVQERIGMLPRRLFGPQRAKRHMQ